MPSRKQRRRRQKERRHEYEYVYVDEEGREVEIDPEQFQAARNGKGEAKAATRTQPRGRRVEPPSWRRVGKRALFFTPIMFLTVMFLGQELTLAQQVLQTAYLVVLFVPFSYLLDRLMYRRYSRHTEAAGSSPKRR